MPKSRHRKNAPDPPAPRQAGGHTPPSPQNDSHDSLSGDAKPRMTQNDSLFQASNPQMTKNDSLFQASMPQMSQNDSHFDVSSFEMSQNDSFSGLSCSTEHPLSVADEPPATPPSPQNDTPSNTRPAPTADPASSIQEKAETGAEPPTRRHLSRGSGKRHGVAMAVNGNPQAKLWFDLLKRNAGQILVHWSPANLQEDMRIYEVHTATEVGF